MQDASRDNPVSGHALINTVLLVDAPSFTNNLRPQLESVGWNVTEASNAGQARAAVALYKPDFIITELALPRVTGFEFCANQKREDCHIPILVLTDVNLDSARNLAVWAGADGYLVKPYPIEELYPGILRIAVAVRDRIKRAEQGLQGGVDFTCSCGKRMCVSAANAGKAVICPACRSLVKSPQLVIGSSVLFRQIRKQTGMGEDGRLGLYCDQCNSPLDMRQHRRREGAKCEKCGKLIKLPGAIIDQWDFFFQSEITPQPPQDIDPLQFVHIICPTCNIFHAFFDKRDQPQPCRQCGQLQSLPSVRGAALSRAALNATGRLFRIRITEDKSALFLLPRSRSVGIGSEPGHALTVSDVGLQPRHCLLKVVASQPVAIPVEGAAVLVNGDTIASETPLKPGDTLSMGTIGIELLGNRTPNEEAIMRTVFKRLEDENRADGKPGFTGPAAQILQLHWEIERERWLQASASPVHG